MVERLKLIRNECLFNSFVMFVGIRRIKKNNRFYDKISYGFNISVVITTLLSIFFTAFTKHKDYDINLYILTFKKMGNDQISLFYALLAFGLSIAIFLFRNKKETKVHYNIANSYWLLHKRVQDLIGLQKIQCSSLYPDLDLYLCHEVEKIKQQMELLVRFSPVFEDEDIKQARKLLTDTKDFLYFDTDDMEEIKKFFDNEKK